MPEPAELHVRRFAADDRADFFGLHDRAPAGGWCYCVAWWVPGWDGWGERTAGQNRTLREQLCDGGEYDGYLAYLAGQVAGWCQAGRRDRLAKLVAQLGLAPAPDTWAITCFFIDPAYRRRGLARGMLGAVLADLRQRGVRRVEAFPKRGDNLDAGDMWTGPEQLFRAAGFAVAREHPQRPVLAIDL